MRVELLAVIIVMALLMALTVLMLRSLASSAGVRVRADMVRLLKAYDDIIDQKGSEIRRLNRQIEQMEQSGQSQPQETIRAAGTAGDDGTQLHTSVPKASYYRVAAFRDSYNAMRENFQPNVLGYQELARQVAEEMPVVSPRGEIAARLRSALGYETVFQLSQLKPDEQLETLDASLSDEDWTLLRDFCQIRLGRSFEIVAFTDWLEEIAALEDDTLTVRCGDQELSRQEGLEYHHQICEGVQIRAGNRLYDYSMKEREIC